MTRKLPLALAALITVMAPAVSAQELFFGGYARNNTAVILNEDLDYLEVQNTFDLKAEYFGDRSAVNAEAYLNSDGVDTLEAGLKELYMDLYFDALDLRIGRQQIIWGKADGVFITDVVSPKDLSDFVLPDFDEIRLGVTALKADLFLDAFDLELVWVPLFTPSVQPRGAWSVSMPLPEGASVNEESLPAASLENGEIFVKLSWMGSLVDLELMGASMWDDLPVPHMTGMGAVTPEYSRILMGAGASAPTSEGSSSGARGPTTAEGSSVPPTRPSPKGWWQRSLSTTWPGWITPWGGSSWVPSSSRR